MSRYNACVKLSRIIWILIAIAAIPGTLLGAVYFGGIFVIPFAFVLGLLVARSQVGVTLSAALFSFVGTWLLLALILEAIRGNDQWIWLFYGSSFFCGVAAAFKIGMMTRLKLLSRPSGGPQATLGLS
jgi:hypothetical protein